MTEDRLATFAEDLELDMSYATDQARFRVNVFQQQGHIGAVMRVIPISIKTIDEIGAPQIAKDIALRPRGLLLVTGPTGIRQKHDAGRHYQPYQHEPARACHHH